jgi:hypothetical protein
MLYTAIGFLPLTAAFCVLEAKKMELNPVRVAIIGA